MVSDWLCAGSWNAIMFGIINLSSYILGALLIILLPGPNSLYVLSTASRFGISAAYQAALAVFLGDSILMLLTALGAASLLQSVPLLFVGLKVIGAAYLAWLGLQLFQAALQLWRHQPQSPAPQQQVSNATTGFFRKALTISLLNPKAILFCLAFFIQFVDVNYAHPSLSFLLLGLIIQVISLSYLSCLIFAGQHLARFFSQHRWLSIASIASVGALFLSFALKLLWMTL
jgi:leucine efflux protein